MKILLTEDDIELADWLIKALRQRYDFMTEWSGTALSPISASRRKNSMPSYSTSDYRRWTGGRLRIATEEQLVISTERLARFQPVAFDSGMVAEIKAAVAARGFQSQRITSGAGHDAQMIERIAPGVVSSAPRLSHPCR